MPTTVHIPLVGRAARAHARAARRDHAHHRGGAGATISASPPRASPLPASTRTPAKAACIGARRSTSSRPPSPSCVAEGIAVTGPHSADTLFHAEARSTYDAAVAMYHDQALIPIKTLAFDTRRQRHARAAVRAHLARPRHGLRTSPAPARRARTASSPRCAWPARSAGAGPRTCRSAAPMSRERRGSEPRRLAAAARGDPRARAVGARRASARTSSSIST